MTDFSVGLNSDGWRLLRGRLTFTGAAGFGQVNDVINIAVVTGQVEFRKPGIYCSEDLATTTGTVSVGVAADNNILSGNAVVAAGDLNVGTWFSYSDGAVGIVGFAANSSEIANFLSGNLILTVLTAGVTDGQLDFFVWWRPLSANGNLALGANMVAI